MTRVRENELRRRLARHLGADYAPAWSGRYALGGIGSLTVDEALADGVDVKRIWLAAWEALELPASER